jgi:translocation and assembly module TamB
MKTLKYALRELKRFFIFTGLLAIVFIFTIGAILFSVEGRNWIVTKIATLGANKAGYSIEIARVDTSIISKWQIDKITLDGTNKLYIESLNIKWKPADLFSGKINIKKLTANDIKFNDNILGDFSSSFIIDKEFTDTKINGDANFNGEMDKINVSLDVKGNATKSGFIIDNLNVKADKQGTIDLKGSYKDETLDFDIKTRAFPSQIISSSGWKLKPGKVKADINIKGKNYDPSINGKIEFLSKLYDSNKTIPFSTKINLKTAKSILNANIDFYKEENKLGYVKISSPIKPYLNFNKLKSEIPLKVKLSTDFDLRYIHALLDREIHDLKGILITEVNLSGTVSKPIINGNLKLKNGYYENSISGAALHKINTELTADNNKVTIIKASASDGEEGKLSLSGYADWTSKSAKPINFKLVADKARILRRHDMDGVVSGNLSLFGTLKILTLNGVLDISPFSMTIDNLPSQGIPELEITEESNGESDKEQEDFFSKNMPIINMDVVLKTDNQAFLRGLGLNAELKGKINLKGTLNKTDYSGSFKTIRGSYEVLGKKFNLKEGDVRFEGDAVSLRILGVHKTKTAEINTELSGTLDDLKLTLSSIPSMPQDEIVSNLLFGKSSGKITPLQAIKLANAIRKLQSGGRSLFDPVGKARDLLGVDSISVDSEQTDDGRDVTVGVGKYVSEKVYLEVEKSSNPAQPAKGKVEVEISPNLSVESSTGGNSGLGGVELKWKYDY